MTHFGCEQCTETSKSDSLGLTNPKTGRENQLFHPMFALPLKNRETRRSSRVAVSCIADEESGKVVGRCAGNREFWVTTRLPQRFSTIRREVIVYVRLKGGVCKESIKTRSDDSSECGVLRKCPTVRIPRTNLPGDLGFVEGWTVAIVGKCPR